MANAIEVAGSVNNLISCSMRRDSNKFIWVKHLPGVIVRLIRPLSSIYRESALGLSWMFYVCLQTQSELVFALPHHKHCDVFVVVVLRCMSRAAKYIIGNLDSSLIHHAVIAVSKMFEKKSRCCTANVWYS